MISARLTRRALLLGATLAAAWRVPPSLAEPVPLRVRLDWTPWGVHGAIHLAQAKGWLASAALDVQVQDGNGSAATIQLIGSNTDFDVGHASLATMMVGRSKGLPIKAIAIFMRQGDIGCFVPKGSGIRGPADLKGKKLIYTPGSLEAPFIDTFLAAGGLRRMDVDLVAVSAASKASAYALGQADAAFSTIPFFLPAVAKARPSDAIRFADYALEMPGYGLISQEAVLQSSKRQALAKYSSIIAATWRYIYDGHQDEAVDAIISQRPQARLDPSILRGQLDSLQDFLNTESSKMLPLGVMEVKDWDIAVRNLIAVGLVDTKSRGSDFIEQGLVKPFSLPTTRQ